LGWTSRNMSDRVQVYARRLSGSCTQYSDNARRSGRTKGPPWQSIAKAPAPTSRGTSWRVDDGRHLREQTAVVSVTGGLSLPSCVISVSKAFLNYSDLDLKITFPATRDGFVSFAGGLVREVPSRGTEAETKVAPKTMRRRSPPCTLDRKVRPKVSDQRVASTVPSGGEGESRYRGLSVTTVEPLERKQGFRNEEVRRGPIRRSRVAG
jgi:hypothetical protein